MMRWLCCAAVLVACSSERVDPPPAVPVNWSSLDRPHVIATRAPTSKERATAEAYVTALGAPQLSALAPLFDDLGHVAFGRKDARGREKVTAFHEQLFGAFDQRKTTVTRIWRTDETQTVEWTLSGVHTREWLGIAPTQRPVAIRGITLLWTRDDGTLTDAHLFFNVAAIKAQLGVGPKDLQERAAALQQTSVQAPPVEQEGSAAEQRQKQVVREELDALEQAKEPEYLERFTDDVAVDSLVVPQLHGKDALKAYYRGIRHAIGQLDTAIENIWAIGSFVVVEYTISGEQVAPFGAVPTTSEHSLRLYVADVIQFQGEKIAHVWRYDGADLAL